MTHYQVLARKYRPKKFLDVIGQEAIVTTLHNTLRTGHLHHAYLFSGPRGTGKTTLARIFGKALNCQNLSADFEPCCACTSCLEIANSSSLDFVEIDGASHRGIDDIRTITESAGYQPQSGKYKIFLIDEVHMLTKEAFNALLKTLEEPPASMKFFFATTEPHKLPETIISRCQRFHLKRIKLDSIMVKLRKISRDLNLEVDEKALQRIAEYAEGGLRDAESLFDQIIAFSHGAIHEEAVHEVLGILPQQRLFDFDTAYAAQNFQFAFELAQELFSAGKDLTHFLTDLIRHFRKLLIAKVNPATLTTLNPHYIQAKELYSEHALMQILEYIVKAGEEMKHALSEEIFLEVLLLKILREKERIPMALLVKKLRDLSQNAPQMTSEPIVRDPLPKKAEVAAPPAPKKEAPKPAIEAKKETKPEVKVEAKPEAKIEPKADARLEILPSLPQKQETAPLQQTTTPIKNTPLFDTLVQFAAVELEGSIQRKK